MMQDISLAAYEAAEGRKQASEVLELVGKLGNPDHDTEIEFVTSDLQEILNDTVYTPGLRWRLTSLNKSIGSLRRGDFGFIFARPETGKTTFLASEVTFMASQLKEDDGPILWFNNEEQGKKVMGRLYQAALGAEKKHLQKATERAQAAYREATHDKIKIVDSASITKRLVENLCKSYKPSLIIFDQIDKIKGFSADRDDIVMGKIYQWARELAKEYCPVIGVCQADGTAEGEPRLHMGHVANAKTAKQAEADFIIGIGKRNDPGFEFIRFLNISKNKLDGDQDSQESLRHGFFNVEIQPTIGRYKDLDTY